jgi:hypothetical protein
LGFSGLDEEDSPFKILFIKKKTSDIAHQNAFL